MLRCNKVRNPRGKQNQTGTSKFTKNNYNIRNNIKTIHHFNTILLKHFNNLSAKTIQYYFKGHNIKITNILCVSKEGLSALFDYFYSMF